MATKRKPIHSSPRMNFRPNIGENAEAKGTKPTAPPTSMSEVLNLIILHQCRRVIFYNVNLKVGIYLAAVFIISLITDHASIPRTYFSRSNNIFNLYFVKIGWLWTLLLTVPFILLTAYTYCCGNRKQIMKNHLLRLGIATVFWLFFTKSFNYIEVQYGYCKVKGFLTKSTCLRSGHVWNGFDISGHTFLLIYSSLILMEEAKAIIGWESIRDHIRNEEHFRAQQQLQVSSNPLRYLNDNELYTLKTSYSKVTPYIRLLFISMTMLLVLWDVMLVSTMLYFHIMIEKFVAACLAILVWYFTYRYWFAQTKLLPSMPGNGAFKYQQIKKQMPTVNRKASMTNSSNGKAIPKFMGMPLYVPRNIDDKCNDSTNELNVQ
ncbi:FIT family protein CG10671-like [Ctenocephalides felis]|uniref:FIT family protein CG10671-like n=1 Tax=Ctenocephalides felis TaxID=7515 RepID=UPI000E6E392A|nr:FIT family protein CG10671-like [Ctenocephalides felis]